MIDAIAILIILCTLAWLGMETDWLRLRLPTGSNHNTLLLSPVQPVLMLPAGNPNAYSYTLTMDIAELKKLIKELSAKELELNEN